MVHSNTSSNIEETLFDCTHEHYNYYFLINYATGSSVLTVSFSVDNAGACRRAGLTGGGGTRWGKS